MLDSRGSVNSSSTEKEREIGIFYFEYSLLMIVGESLVSFRVLTAESGAEKCVDSSSDCLQSCFS